MNYIREINAFRQWKSQNRISGNTQALWYELMAVCNALNWAEEFTVPTTSLANEFDISRQELHRIRSVLVEKGRILYQKGSGNRSGLYRMIPFESQQVSQNMTQGITQDVTQDLSQTAASALLYKQNETKKNEIRKKERKRTSFAEVIASFLFDGEVEEEIGNFIQMRTLSKKPLTDNALKLILTKLLDYQKNDQLAMLRASVINCWADVYPPKGKEALKEPEKLDYSTDGW